VPLTRKGAPFIEREREREREREGGRESGGLYVSSLVLEAMISLSSFNLSFSSSLLYHGYLQLPSHLHA